MHIADKTGFRYTLAARLGVGITAGMFATLLLAPPAQAEKPTPPLTMTAAFDSTKPELNKNEILRITLTTTKAYSNLAIAAALPPQIALVSGNPAWKGALNVGEQRELVLTVMLKTTGRYTINVDAAFDPVESSLFTTAQISLNVIAEAGGVTASMDDFTMMDLKRAKTPAEKSRILGAQGIETQTPAATVTPRELPSFLKPAGQEEKPAPRKPESRLQDTLTVTVSGYMKYKDSADVEHPIRMAKVRVFNVNAGGTDEVMGEGNTDADGAYSIAATGGDADSGPDIKVRVYCAIANDLVASVGPDAASTYYMEESAVHTDYAASTLSVSLTTGKPVPGSTTDDESARRFSVLDAVLQFAVEAYALRDLQLMPKIPIIFPAAGTSYNKVDVLINVIRKDALDWDVIGHEYAHYLANKGASSVFANSPGGPHDGSSTIPSNGKEKGIRLAWSEGWATFFEIAAQVEPTQTLLALPAVPNAGDRIYHDTEDSAAADDLETFSNTGLTGAGQGYASEFSIMGMFYDLCDGSVDKSTDGLSQDTIDITLKGVWNILNAGDFDSVGKFYNALCLLVGYDIPMMFTFSQIFALNNVGPELKAPTQGQIVSSAISPEFSWLPNGDPTAGYAHDRFTLVFAKNNFTQIIGMKDNIQDTKYTCTDAEWQAITSQSDNTGMLQWAVLGYNSLDPRMPPAWGLGNFLSNVQYFQLRAYHIRLRWSTLGADVDLHLSPPSGTDCYYNNRNPDWGVQGDSSDDPSLDRDCITSCTEENITLDKVIDPGTYRVWVHYYSDHDKGPTTALVEVYRYGQLIGSAVQGLAETGDRWDVFSFSIGGAGVASIEANHGKVIPGVAVSAPKAQEE